MDAALVTVGDELLAGDTENTNATWLAGRLSDRGVAVKRTLVVPDVRSVIADAVDRYSDAFDVVLVTGGLGRTPDDVTVEAVADAFDRGLVVDEVALADVERTLEAIAGEYPDLEVDAAAEAQLPEGSRPLVNHAGLSPGCVVDNVYVLPGIPSEMERMFELVAEAFNGDTESRYLYTEEPEANLLDRLEDVRDRFGVAVGCYPDRDAGHNRLQLKATDPDALDDAASWLADRLAVVDPDDAA